MVLLTVAMLLGAGQAVPQVAAAGCAGREYVSVARPLNAFNGSYAALRLGITARGLCLRSVISRTSAFATARAGVLSYDDDPPLAFSRVVVVRGSHRAVLIPLHGADTQAAGVAGPGGRVAFLDVNHTSKTVRLRLLGAQGRLDTLVQMPFGSPAAGNLSPGTWFPDGRLAVLVQPAGRALPELRVYDGTRLQRALTVADPNALWLLALDADRVIVQDEDALSEATGPTSAILTLSTGLLTPLRPGYRPVAYDAREDRLLAAADDGTLSWLSGPDYGTVAALPRLPGYALLGGSQVIS